MEMKSGIPSDIKEFNNQSQLKLVVRILNIFLQAQNVIKGIFTKPFFTLKKLKLLIKRVRAINLIYTVKQNLTKHIQEVLFRKFSKNFSRSNNQLPICKLAENSSNVNKQNHFYKTIKRFKKLLNSQDDNRDDIKNKDIVFKHLDSIFPKNYVKNYCSYKWWNPEEKLKDEENLREAYIFYGKGDPKLLRFMEFITKKEKNYKNLRNFLIARLNNITIFNNTNIFALANLTDQLYYDLNSESLCRTCYCKEGEENAKFNDKYYCNCQCHIDLQEQGRSVIQSEELSLRDSIDMYICDDLSKSKMDYDEYVDVDQSIQIKLKLKKKEKRELESNISKTDEFISRLYSTPSKMSKIDILFKKVTEKFIFKSLENREIIKIHDQVDEYSRSSVIHEERKKDLFLESRTNDILDLNNRKIINSFQSIDIDPKKRISDDDKRRTEDDDVLIKKYNDEFKKRLIEDEMKKKKFEELLQTSNKDNKLIKFSNNTRTNQNSVQKFSTNKNKIPTVFSQIKSNLSLLKKNVPKLENKLNRGEEQSVHSET